MNTVAFMLSCMSDVKFRATNNISNDTDLGKIEKHILSALLCAAGGVFQLFSDSPISQKIS